MSSSVIRWSGLAAMVLTITLAVTTPAFAQRDFNTAKPIPGYPHHEITEKGVLIEGGDVVLGKCSTLFQDSDLLSGYGFYEEAVSACEKAGYTEAGYTAPLANTGGLPVVLVPIALLAVCGLLIRKSVAG